MTIEQGISSDVGCAYEGLLAVVLETVLAGDLTGQTGTERRVVESLGALLWLVRLHQPDERGRCRVCQSGTRWRLSRRRPVCTVYRALFINLRVSGRLPMMTGGETV